MIPKSFSVLCHDVKVVFRKDLQSDCEAFGRWWQAKNLIEIQTPNQDVTREYAEQAFWHEAVHAIFDSLGYSEDSKDERKVDTVASCIVQILKTSKGEQ